MSWRLATSDTLSYLVYQAPGAVTRLQRRPAACRFTALLSARFNHSEYPPRSHSLKPVPSIASSCNQRGRHNRLSRQARHLHPALYKRRAAAKVPTHDTDSNRTLELIHLRTFGLRKDSLSAWGPGDHGRLACRRAPTRRIHVDRDHQKAHVHLRRSCDCTTVARSRSDASYPFA